MRKRVILVIGAFSALLGCGSNSPTYGGGVGSNACTPTATQVCMMNLAFNPSNLTIAHGTTVTWKNGDAVNHTVGNATGSADTYTSGFIAGGGTFSHTFATAGTFNYYCAIHGADGSPPTGMRGTITVN
jgi:plastocyanin